MENPEQPRSFERVSMRITYKHYNLLQIVKHLYSKTIAIKNTSNNYKELCSSVHTLVFSYCLMIAFSIE